MPTTNDPESWVRLYRSCDSVFAWVERPGGVIFYANFDDGYLYAQADNYRYGPSTLRMAREDATGWKPAHPPMER